uniref:THO complex subunit 1 n=1 Tax=Plectus sambesii TaxID=2011161 RepID=A0A914WID7_9BILA
MEAAIRSRNISALKSAQQAIKPNHSQQDVDIRTETDMVMRKVAASFVTDKVADAELHQFFNFVIECSENELCGKIVPVSVLQDILDVSSVERCEQLFSLVEDHIPTWKSPFFFEQCRNHVLRLCNDLLKRLSRTVDTAFCGRILVFLARCLPLTEKSGLNLVSQFNVDNSTRYEQEQTDQSLLTDNNDIEMEEGEMKDSNIPVDYALYCKFWQLQTFFSSPTTCYDKIGWKKFQHNANEVFSALASYKLEEGSGRKRHLDASISEPAGKSMKMDTSADNESATAIKLMANREQRRSLQTEKTRDSYFAKYLTSQKLLQLQLNDSEFRRYFLVQCIILFQYLQTDVKFKDKKVHSLADEQTRWIEDMAEKCYKLLRETHPDGARFAQAVKHIMDREKHWSEWKNQGCPDFTSMTDKEKMQMFKKRPKQRYDPNKIDLGNPELTKLWNIEPDTLASCRANPRRFIPRLEDFLVDPLDEMDPEQQVDEEYRSTNNEVFQWRAMRLLSMTSSQFFTPTNRDANLTKMTTFLESLIQRTAATIP